MNTPVNRDIPEAGCQLMDSFGIFIQLCLASTAFSTLIYKRQREEPQRPIRIWALDVSKQLAGGILIHALNIVAAVFFGVNPEEGEHSNPCVWYFLNILVDTTLGIGILWAILTGFKYIILKLSLTGFQSGVYGDPPLINQLMKWTKQLIVYVISLFMMKVIVVSLFHLCPWISEFGDWVLQWTEGNHRLQVAFVMLIFPLIMNIMQFWVIDTIVKHKTVDDHNIKLVREDEENLLDDEESEEDFDDIHLHANDNESYSTRIQYPSDSSSSYGDQSSNEYELRTKIM
ncbi:vacuolar membrane protein-domain-containing protein [Pilobolus umbonatus]|nr:vacuolar membrane protein-domain-containing protein [Pilobolus umbonatus]